MEHTQIYTRCLAFQLSQARKKVFAWYEAFLKPLGLTPAAVYVLGALRDVEQSTPSEIADLLQTERPTMTSLLGRMERDGLVHRTPNPDNRRELRVRLTEKGERLCDEAYPRLVEADRRLNDALNGTFDTLMNDIVSLNDTLKERTP